MDSQASAKFTALACRVSGFTVGFVVDQGREEREGEEGELKFIMGSSKSPKRKVPQNSAESGEGCQSMY